MCEVWSVLACCACLRLLRTRACTLRLCGTRLVAFTVVLYQWASSGQALWCCISRQAVGKH